MPPGDALRVDEGTNQLALDQIRSNSQSVIEDQHRFQEIQALHADHVRPPSFEECLAQGYDLEPEPLAESEVPQATQDAVKAFEKERSRAGGIVPEGQALILPEPPDGLPDPTEVPAPEASAGGPSAPQATAPPPTHLVDFQEIRAIVEQLAEMQGAITGMGMRVTRLAEWINQQKNQDSSAKDFPSGAPAPVSGKGETQEAAVALPPPSPPPRKPGPPEKARSIQERRAYRQRGGSEAPGFLPEGPGDGQDLPDSVDAGGGEAEATPAVSGRSRAWKWPSLPSLPKMQMPGPLAGALGCGALAILAAAVALAGRRAEPAGEDLLVERQVQGVGAYVRTEEHELQVSRARGASIEREIAQMRIDSAVAQSDQAKKDIQRRLAEAEKRLDRSRRATSGLQVLEEVSGIKMTGLDPSHQ